jgi:CubicO group peptidase (beta-lactamase class C family)
MMPRRHFVTLITGALVHWTCALLILLLTVGTALAEAQPVFSLTGPDAAVYGAAEGYPLGTPGPPMNSQPFIVGSYSHYDEILKARVVPRSAQASAFSRAPQEMALAYTHQGSPQTIETYLERHPTTGLLVARDRTILYEHYRYGRTDTQRLTSQSMAKTITSMLVGIAIDEGAISSVDDSASIYVPELAGSALGATPIRALLHMASGIAFRETYDGTDDASKLNRDLWRRDSPGPARAMAQFDTRKAPPDTVWYYAGLNTELLGLILTRATRMHPADYLANRIWQKIGAEADASWVVDATGQEAVFCCVNAVLRDWARLAVLLANDGAWDGVQVIPRQWVRDATTAAPAGHFLAPGTASRFYGYGYQVWILPGPRRQFALLGIHGQTILVDPASKLVLVHTAVRLRPTGDPMASELISLWNAVVAQQGSSGGAP